MLVGPATPSFVYKEGKFTLVMLDSNGVTKHWTVLERILNKFPETWNRGNKIENIRIGLEMDQIRAWVVLKEKTIHHLLLTVEAEFATMKSLQVVVGIGNDLDSYLPILLSGLENYAFNRGCKGVEIIGREGWKRKLAPFGYDFLQMHMFKEVSHKGIN